MLEKLKHKFKKKDPAALDMKKAGKKGLPEDPGTAVSPKKKRSLPVKQLVILFIVIVVSVILAFFAYQFFVKKDDSAPGYIPKELSHVTLPDEIMEFCFDQLPNLYQSFLVYNDQMMQIDNEIKRISEIARQYPDQQKITDKEINIWEKIRLNLFKEFEKIQTVLREMYVLYRVNPDQGRTHIESGRTNLNDAARTVLTEVLESTQTLEPLRTPPKGIVQKIKQTIQKMIQ